jgi:hypothetical protein
VSASPEWRHAHPTHTSALEPDRRPSNQTGDVSIDGRQHLLALSSIRDHTDDTAESGATDDCPWCAALLETSPPPSPPPSGSRRRRYDPYVSGALYDVDDW